MIEVSLLELNSLDWLLFLVFIVVTQTRAAMIWARLFVYDCNHDYREIIAICFRQNIPKLQGGRICAAQPKECLLIPERCLFCHYEREEPNNGSLFSLKRTQKTVGLSQTIRAPQLPNRPSYFEWYHGLFVQAPTQTAEQEVASCLFTPLQIE